MTYLDEIELKFFALCVAFIVLPVLGEGPSVITTTVNTVTLEWTQWREGVDPGDPPVIEYALYARQPFGNWTEKVRVDQSIASTVVTGLESNTDYEFSVAAVRDGIGGLGPRSPSVSASTTCESK